MKQRYLNPYLIGVLLGLVLLSSFIIAGRGIGASGAMSQTLAHVYEIVQVDNHYLEQQKSNETFLETWIIIEVFGIFLGAFISAWQSGRLERTLVKGEGISKKRRIMMALIGGIFMGFAARLARGCTSGQALTGGALLSAGSWIFMIAIFVGAYITIIFFKRNW